MPDQHFDFGSELDLLRGLDEIDWSSVRDAYGPATDTPQRIRELLSPDPKRRENAADDLLNSACHQGTRYPAAALIVPFLLRLAASPTCPDRSGIVWLLPTFAIGDDGYWIPTGFPAAHFREQLRSVDQDDNLKAAMDAYDAVGAGVPLLISLVDEWDLATRCGACYCLAWFPEQASQIVPALVKQASEDPHETVAATALVSAGLVASGQTRELVISQMDNLRPKSPLLSWAAAIAYARLGGSGAPDWVPAELCGWVAGTISVPRHYISFLGGDLEGYAAASLLMGGEAWLDQAVKAMLRRLQVVTGAESLNLLRSLLAVIFPKGPVPRGTKFADLTELQQLVI